MIVCKHCGGNRFEEGEVECDCDYKTAHRQYPPLSGSESLDFRQEIEVLLNKCSKENWSDTPDFILAKFLVDSLKTFDECVSAILRDEKERGGAMKDIDVLIEAFAVIKRVGGNDLLAERLDWIIQHHPDFEARTKRRPIPGVYYGRSPAEALNDDSDWEDYEMRRGERMETIGVVRNEVGAAERLK